MNRAHPNVAFLLSQAALLAVIGTIAHAQAASSVLVAKFVGTLNTKSAKVGDPVVAMTERPAKMADGKEIPKRALINGKVVAVKSKSAGSGNSMLAIKFDLIDVNGTKLPIQGQIVAIGIRSETIPAENSYLGYGNSTPTLVVDPVATTTGTKATSPDSLAIATGSTLPGVTVALHLNDDGATELNGYKREIKLDSSVLVKIKLN